MAPGAGALGAWLDGKGVVVVRPDRYVYGAVADAAALAALSDRLGAQLHLRDG